MMAAMANVTETDVLIVGAGVAGLFLAADLAESGLRVCVVESGPHLAPGASTKNEGMLHRGTYHAAAIADEGAAIAVAQRCSYGYFEILRRAPEAVVDSNIRTFVLIQRPENMEQYQSRWLEADVPHRQMTRAAARTLLPEVDHSILFSVFEVEDKSVDARILYRELATRAIQCGARIITGAEISRIHARDNIGDLCRDGLVFERIAARAFVYVAGSALPRLLWELLSIRAGVRLWKSHLLDLPRASTHNLFFIERDGITLMHHGAWSIAGLNADAQPVDTPSLEPVEEQAELLKRRVSRVIPSADVGQGVGRACLKVDCLPDAAGANGNRTLSLDAAFYEPLSGHIWAVPGKMTEAPHLSHSITSELRRRLRPAPHRAAVTGGADPVLIAPRPIDLRTPITAGAAAGVH
jgi:glycine/D-amino acid oxidase-like deaminating enzyme